MKAERLFLAGENKGDWGEYWDALSDKDSGTEIKLIKVFFSLLPHAGYSKQCQKSSASPR